MYKTKHVIRDPLHGNVCAVATYPINEMHEGKFTKEGAKAHAEHLVSGLCTPEKRQKKTGGKNFWEK